MPYSKEWLSEQEIEKLFLNPNIKTRDLMLMKLLYYGALRVSEGINAKKEDLRIEGEKTYLLLKKQKTSKKDWEKQPIPKRLYAELLRYSKENNIKARDYLFPSKMRKQVSRGRAIQICKESVLASGIDKNITTHSFRRSRLTHLLENDYGDYRTSIFARHKNLGSLRPYLKLAKAHLQEKMEAIDKYV